MTSARLARLLLPALLAASLHAPATAGCSRPILVPAAPSGHSVTVNGSEIGGMMPDMLALIGAKAGCTFVWSIVPRIRVEAMFESGSADLLVTATEVARRGRHGVFVPIVEARPTLISLAGTRAPVTAIADLLARRELRVALVRGYDYGDAYQAMARTLAQQGRLYLEKDPTTVARLINDGMADVTIMPAASFIAGLDGDSRIEGMATRLRVEPLPELAWIRTGIYISRKSVSAADRKVLEDAISGAVKSGLWWEALKRTYTPALLNQNARPLSATH